MAVVTFTADDARRGNTLVLPWVEFFHRNNLGATTVRRWSSIAIPDATYKEPRLLELGSVTRRLSDEQGLLQTASTVVRVSDTDRTLLDLFNDANLQWFPNRQLNVYLTHAAARAVSDTPLVLFRGYIQSYGAEPGRQVTFSVGDLISGPDTAMMFSAELPKRRLLANLVSNDPSLGCPEPIIYGTVSTTEGAVPCLSASMEDATWYRFVVAGHACKSVTEVFVNGVSASSEVGNNILIPGGTGWPYGTPYRDLLGRRYTVIYAKGTIGQEAASGAKPLTVNVQGIETVGDGSGTLITKIYDQYYHWLVNFAFGNYLTGAWLSAPVWDASLDNVPRIDATSFDTAETLTDSRVVGGYVGAGIIGNNGEVATMADWIANWNRCADVDCGINTKGQFFVIVPEPTTATKTFNDVTDIIEDTFETPVSYDTARNVIPYSYMRNYLKGGWGGPVLDLSRAGRNPYDYGEAEVYNQGAIDGYGSRLVDQIQEYGMIRAASIAENIAAYRLSRLMYGKRRVSFKVPLYGVHVELGETINVTHSDAPGSNGWTNRKVYVDEIEVDVENASVRIGGVDTDSRYVGLSYSTATARRNATSSTSTFVSVEPGIKLSLLTTTGVRFLGGSRQFALIGGTNTYIDAVDYLDVLVDWTQINGVFTLQARIWSKTATGACTITPSILRVGGTNTDGSGHTSTTWNEQTFSIASDTVARTYRLQLKTSSNADEVYVIGQLEFVPV